MRLKLGRLDLAYKGEIYFSDLYFNSKEDKCIIGPHHLFEDKIVQISYDRKYLRVLDSVDGLEGYERIPYKVNKKDRRFYIPISVCVQGKVFHIEEVLLDTGFNGAFITSGKLFPGLDLKRGRLPDTTAMQGKIERPSMEYRWIRSGSAEYQLRIWRYTWPRIKRYSQYIGKRGFLAFFRHIRLQKP